MLPFEVNQSPRGWITASHLASYALLVLFVASCEAQDATVRLLNKDEKSPVSISTASQRIRNAFPIKNAVTQLDGMFPFSIFVTPTLTKPGTGYSLALSWTFVQPSLSLYPTYRIEWFVFVSDSDVPDGYYENGDVAQSSDGTVSFSTSRPLAQDKVYRFQISGAVVPMDSAGNELTKQVTYTDLALVTVDLRNM